MAKQQGINLLGIQREMLKAGQDNRAQAFVQGAMGAFANINKQNEEAENILQQHMEDLGGIQNINKISPEQRGPVTEFMRNARDEYYKLATEYEKTKSPEIKDKMDAIKFKATSLNEQLSQFAENKAEYLQDFEEGDLMKGGTFAKDNAFFTGVYGNPNAQFSIDQETGDISFTANGETRSFKKFGTHTLRNYEGEQSFESLVNGAAKLKVQGGFLNKASVVSTFINNNKGMSKNDLQALMQTDLTGDESDLSFIQQWASGDLTDKSMYNGVTLVDDGSGKKVVSEEDVQALLNNKQASLDLMGKYVGNIAEGMFTNTNTDPKILQQQELQQARIDALREKNEGDETAFTKPIRFGPLQGSVGNQYRSEYSPEEAQSIVNKIKNGDSFTFFGYDYKFENNEWVQTDMTEGDSEDAEGNDTYGTITARYSDADQLVKNVIQSNHPGFLNLKTQPKVNIESGKVDVKPSEIISKENIEKLGTDSGKKAKKVLDKIIKDQNITGIEVETTFQGTIIMNGVEYSNKPGSENYKTSEQILEDLKKLVEKKRNSGEVNMKLDKGI